MRSTGTTYGALAGILIVIACAAPAALSAQRPAAFIGLGGAAEDRLRIDQLLGLEETSGFLLRSPSSLSVPPEGEGLRWAPLDPEVMVAWNSALPFSMNEGSLWAGRGLSTRTRAGLRARWGPLSLVLAPELVVSENRHFDLGYEPRPGDLVFARPWRRLEQTADIPMRFGDQPLVMLDPGQSTLALEAGPITLGGSTESQWWGPGIRNAIVLSSNPGGLPHVFLRTSRPVRTNAGDFEARWFVGWLTESLYFDLRSGNDFRSLSAVAFTYRPPFDRDFTLGIARTVYGPATDRLDVLSRAFDAITVWERRPAVEDTLWMPEREQLTSLFARWVLPDDGFEAYLEWARVELPVSFRDLLVAPHHSQGYTLGLQWAGPAGAAGEPGTGTVRLQAEATYLEQSATFRQRVVPTFYTSRNVPQGYTHRGQVIGAAIGPGSSSQWVAGDYLTESWQAGLYLARVRWETDAFFTSESPGGFRPNRSFHARDVSIMGGVRGGLRVGAFRVGAELGRELRYNYRFQNPDAGFSPEGAVDVWNTIGRLTISPERGR